MPIPLTHFSTFLTVLFNKNVNSINYHEYMCATRCLIQNDRSRKQTNIEKPLINYKTAINENKRGSSLLLKEFSSYLQHFG